MMLAHLGAINMVVDASTHFLQGLVSTWLNCLAQLRRVDEKFEVEETAQEPACWHY